MIARRRHTRHFLTASLILIGLLLTTTSFVARGEQQPSGSNERLRELQTERYNLLKEMFETMQQSLAFGGADLGDYRDATIALHRAEAELCTTNAARIKVHEKLVEAMKTQQDQALRREAAGRITRWELDEAKAATLQAQIDLERLRLGQ